MLLNIKNIHKRSGFTIIELIVVIVVIAILAALIVIAYNGVRRQAIISAILADLNNQQKILEVYKVDHGSYPNIIGCPSDETTNTLCIKERNSETKYTYITDNPNNPQAYFLAAKRSEMYYETVNGESPKEFLLKWKQVSSGGSHTCAININDKVYCWGNNTYGQLGRISPSYLSGNNSNIPIPINNAGVIKKNKIISVSAGDNHTCAIDDKGIAYCWGKNDFGQIGNNSTDLTIPDPVKVLSGETVAGTTFLSISAGGSHTCAIMSNNDAYCWGNNDKGQLGTFQFSGNFQSYIDLIGDAIFGSGNPEKINIPKKVNKNGTIAYSGPVSSISAGYKHTCVVSNNKAYCWGDNSSNQLGLGLVSLNKYALPVSVATLFTAISGKNIKSISGGNGHTCAIDNNTGNRKAYCWGSGSFGQIGDGETSSKRSAVSTNNVGGSGYLDKISLGSNFSCSVNSLGDGYCWGQNNKGQIGQNVINTGYSSPKILLRNNIPNGTNFKQIDTGSDFACSIMTDDAIYCWGNNLSGQIGINTFSDSVSLPTIISYPY